jgi:hypothetical protein
MMTQALAWVQIKGKFDQAHFNKVQFAFSVLKLLQSFCLGVKSALVPP